MKPARFDVLFHLDAQAEALDAAEYIARDSPKNAAKWYAGLEKAILSLSMFPHRCRVAPKSKYLDRELRHFIYKSHRIIFSIDEEERVVRVLHVRHAARRAIGEPEQPPNGD